MQGCSSSPWSEGHCEKKVRSSPVSRVGRDGADGCSSPPGREGHRERKKERSSPISEVGRGNADVSSSLSRGGHCIMYSMTPAGMGYSLLPPSFLRPATGVLPRRSMCPVFPSAWVKTYGHVLGSHNTLGKAPIDGLPQNLVHFLYPQAEN